MTRASRDIAGKRNIYNHENLNALRAHKNRQYSQPTQENCNPQKQPQNKNFVFLDDL